MSPAVRDGVVYCAGRVDQPKQGEPMGRLFALDAASGKNRWVAPVDDLSLRTSPAVAGDTVYLSASTIMGCAAVGSGGSGSGGGSTRNTSTNTCTSSSRGRLYAYDRASGSQRWTAETHPDTRSSPAVTDGVVYVGCANGISAVTTDGDVAWRVNFGDHDVYADSSPAVADGRVFVGCSDGNLRAIVDGQT